MGSYFASVAEEIIDLVDMPSYFDDSFHDDVQALYDDLMARREFIKNGGHANVGVVVGGQEDEAFLIKPSHKRVMLGCALMVLQFILLVAISWFCAKCYSKRQDNKMELPLYAHM